MSFQIQDHPTKDGAIASVLPLIFWPKTANLPVCFSICVFVLHDQKGLVSMRVDLAIAMTTSVKKLSSVTSARLASLLSLGSSTNGFESKELFPY